MDVRLKVLGGSHEGEEILVPGDVFVIGRGEECHLRPQSDLISRRHCALVIAEAGVVLQDFGSKNGTFVNDARVDGQRTLRSGDRLRVGQLQFEVLLVPTIGGAKRPEVTSIKDAANRAAQAAARRPPDPDSLFDDAPAAIVETSRPPAADTMQFAPPTINDVADASSDENPSGAPPADGTSNGDGDKKPQNRLRKFFGRE
jgi:predicted component of type VI protein secretion system